MMVLGMDGDGVSIARLGRYQPPRLTINRLVIPDTIVQSHCPSTSGLILASPAFSEANLRNIDRLSGWQQIGARV